MRYGLLMAPFPSQQECVPVTVVAVVVVRAGRYLACRRPRHKRHGGLWEFPGGKLRDGESLADAARREMAEELGVRVLSVGAPRFTHTDPGTPFRIRFVDASIQGTPRPIEHEEIRWCRPEALPAMAFSPADAAFVRTISAASPAAEASACPNGT